ncbi:MAG TPA: DUF983 domain-containing protein [Flavobacterium sp.]|nr:DUF983 domain-containing protein [Flavobacterium sp.]
MSYVSNVLKGTCPSCGQTKVFKSKGNPILFKLPMMHQRCANCNYSFHRETGFYFGAMYMSYALTVGEMVAVFVLGLLLNMSFMNMFIGVVVIVLLLSTFNYRVSRLMWLNMFYDEDDKE